MATVLQGPTSKLMTLLELGWYAGLVGAAFVMLLVTGDPAAAIVLAIVVPVALLRSPGAAMFTTLSMTGVVAILGLYLSSGTGSGPAFRSMMLSMGMLAPVLGVATALPPSIRWIHRTFSEEAITKSFAATTGDQSSMMLMSDSTVCGTLGRVTSDTNRSKAA